MRVKDENKNKIKNSNFSYNFHTISGGEFFCRTIYQNRIVFLGILLPANIYVARVYTMQPLRFSVAKWKQF